jgi:hypothetical protein
MHLSSRKVAAFTAVIAALALLAAWARWSSSAAAPYDTIDGRAVGPVTDCAGLRLTRARCERALVYTRSGLEQAHPGHAPIIREILHADTTLEYVDGQWQPGVRSGEFVAMVEFDLADGTWGPRSSPVACSNQAIPSATPRCPDR